jgi:dephospho-CoA kinase
MIVLGLTGSIGMGKSTTALMFKDSGIAVYDADAIVHRLYAGKAAPLVEASFPGTTGENGVDRNKLAKIVVGNEQQMKKLEAIVHPLVRAEEEAFLSTAKTAGASMVILDIPLLYETGGDKRVDGVVVVTAPQSIQQQRVLAREGMSEDKFLAILARQYPDDKKRQHADFVIDTSKGMETAREEVVSIIEQVQSGKWQPSSN